MTIRTKPEMFCALLADAVRAMYPTPSLPPRPSLHDLYIAMDDAGLLVDEAEVVAEAD